ncbi:inter-alpha-trypsin inhibitor-like [Brachyhypopomus gauderio]|uniref:inter-alpha-trypsin inhibitor-like n=1 Tax=Brachyhypopomus gauderio TaxID=698409 RepID=UPI0040431400
MRNLSTFLIFAIFCCIKGQAASPSLCDQPKDEGTGTDVVVYLYYNKTADKCYPFRYQGQGGNSNRFIAEVYCMKNCSARAESIYPTDRSKACHFEKASGECYASYLRYYYDSVNGKCKTFSWTGCVGNGNRFLDLDHCNSTCFGIQGEGHEKEEDVESDTPLGLILGVVLGIVGVIILIVVLALMLKNSSRTTVSGSLPCPCPVRRS